MPEDLIVGTENGLEGAENYRNSAAGRAQKTNTILSQKPVQEQFPYGFVERKNTRQNESIASKPVYKSTVVEKKFPMTLK